MDIYMARHGQTIYNAKRCYYGQFNPELTSQGRIQAENLGHQMLEQALVFDCVYTSTLIRTKQTAELALKVLNQPNQPIIIEVADLMERDFGDWEGLTADQVGQADPVNWQEFLEHPFEARPNNGEAFDHFKNRVIKAFEGILKGNQASDKILLVGHLGVLRIIVQTFFVPQSDFWEIEFEQGQLYKFEWN